MNKLKTLKELGLNADFCRKCNDLATEGDGWCHTCGETSQYKTKKILLVDDSRQEAINHIKELRKIHGFWTGEEEVSHISIESEKAVEYFIKHFFNVTEEDLINPVILDPKIKEMAEKPRFRGLPKAITKIEEGDA